MIIKFYKSFKKVDAKKLESFDTYGIQIGNKDIELTDNDHYNWQIINREIKYKKIK